ncbi:MAG: hypothetical protein NTZ46_04985 [Verrucomicrobia bacterium]|nr:hypothetical protein [Verrucomicrobiota bacterium]
MDWIKKNYDRFALLLLALALLVSSGAIIYSIKSYPERFAPIQAVVPHGAKVTSLETEALEQANRSLAKPAAWEPHNSSLYVSRKYVARHNSATGADLLIDPFEPGSAPLHPPIPNDWFLKNKLEDRILDADVLEQDEDKDGFSNLDEFLGKTDPQKADSHPPYLTKLRLKRFIRIPFRLKFEAYDDDGNFQINTVDVRQPTQFVKMGETIAGTKYKVVKFEKKSVPNPSTGVDKDTTELTVEHGETGVKVVLVVGTEVNSPDQYARFAFLWDHTEFTVKRDQKFFLKPEPGIEYKLIDIGESEAVIINVKTEGDPIKVPHLD